MADIILTDTVIPQLIIPERVQRASCRVERSGNLNNGDTIRVVFQIKQSGESEWTTFELRTYTPTENVSVGKTLDLISEIAIYERDE